MLVHRLVIAVLAVTFPLRAAAAQTELGAGLHATDEHDHDHDHGHLHFSHPLVTESPTPDTKIRVDSRWLRTGPADARTQQHEVAVEGEYELLEGLSVAVTVPYVSRHSPGAPAVRGVGSTELSLKAASLRWGEHGLLVGGGISSGLPTGSDATGIGSSRAVELEPFVDVGVKRGRVELASFLTYGTTFNEGQGVPEERELTFDGSVLYPVLPAIEVLMEAELGRPFAGDERTIATSVAPGVKVYPFTNRALMFGVSAPIGMSGESTNARSLLVAAFYHF